jgi:hypothetical protein
MRRKSRRARVAPRPDFSISLILGWADAHHQRKGQWPRSSSGPVRDGPLGVNWRNVDTALRLGLHGLEGGSSLARLLAEQRQVPNQHQLPRLTHKQVLAWADAHHKSTDSWPTSKSGPVANTLGEKWRALDTALRLGLRGLPGGSSLAQLLAQERGVRNIQQLPRLTQKQILAWADAHQRRTGSWPTSDSGSVADAPGETWHAIHSALLLGRRGLPGGSTLPQLLAEHRKVRNPRQLPRLSVKKILTWARAHRQRTGQWPTRATGPIPEAPGETWSAVNSALTSGCRGLAPGMTLTALLAAQRIVPRESDLPRLTVKQILAWADAHHERTGTWPHARCGPIAEAPTETWRGVDNALRNKQRGLTGGITLFQLLSAQRGLRDRQRLPPLTEKRILAWAEAHQERTDSWPTRKSGPIAEAQGETWRGVDGALQNGGRGVAGGRSLAGFLAQARGVRNRTNLPRLKLTDVVAWAKAHRRHTGNWPTDESGAITEAPGETWKGVGMALRWGYRGLTGGTTLARLLAQKLGVRNRSNLPVLTDEQILAWAEAHHRRTGAWPTKDSGKIGEADGETWNGVEQALKVGYRGHPGGSSLAQLLDKHRQPGQ